MKERNQKTLILGIGNTLLADEGVGVHMLDHLRCHCPDMDRYTLLDGGTLSFTLAPWLEQAECLIVIDAAQLDAAPGTVQLFEGEAMDRFAGRARRSVHEVSLADLLAIARLTDSLPPRRALVAIQPGSVDWGDKPTEPVQLALPHAARLVQQLLDAWSGSRAAVSRVAPLRDTSLAGTG